MSKRWLSLSFAGLVLLVVGMATGGSLAAKTRVVAHPAYSTACSDPYPSARDPKNPLMLSPAPTGNNPLQGANFFVDGPAHGAAAGEIAKLLGIDTNIPTGSYLPAFKDDESWATFQQYVNRELPSHPAVAGRIRELEKIAVQPEAQRFSTAAEGGTISGLQDFVRKLFCHNFTADPGTIPIITTYFLHPALHGCPTTSQIDAYMPLFKRRVNTVVRGTGNRPAVYLLELDAIGSSSCMVRMHSIGAWEAALGYEMNRFATLPHAVVYVEGGYSDANGPSYTANVMKKLPMHKIEGFFTNDTHNNWTIDEINWGEKVAAMTGGTHFVINTSTNGQGPLLNPHPTTQGIENLCNPPNRGLGPQPTTTTGYRNVDAFMWTHVPGNSSGRCNGGPSPGSFWPLGAERLAERANNRLGPGFPSAPY
jgi:endoglucanase